MLRFKAILRCVYHAFLPPFVERWQNGRVHYQQYKDGSEKEAQYRLSYLGHLRLNLWAVYVLAFHPAWLSEEDRAFHQL